MASRRIYNTLSTTIRLQRQSPRLYSSRLRYVSSRAARVPVITSSSHYRPTLNPRHQPVARHMPNVPSTSRSIFIQTEDTPNQNALKFIPNYPVLPENLSSQFIEYLSPRSTLAPPYPSPLAARLLSVDGVSAVFFGPDFITITKHAETNWAHIKPEVFSLITEAVTAGEKLVNVVEPRAAADDAQQQQQQQDSAESGAEAAKYNPEDEEVVGMIEELLETRIRPAIQEDGGDIEFRGFKDGNVLLKLRGACRTCDSSTVTLKNGIESMLMHYIEEVKSVTQVLDQEEEIAQREFRKFEEKLRQQKGPGATATSNLDTADA